MEVNSVDWKEREMNKITAQTIALCFLVMPCFSGATTITNTPLCTYEPIPESVDSPKYSTLMKCKVWQSDGKSQKIFFYKFTNPTLTPLKNCTLAKERLDNLSKENLYAPTVSGECQPHQSGHYISMAYVPKILDNDVVFNQILKLTSDLEKKGGFARDRMDIPFYEFWFCEQCNKFLDSINKGDAIAVRSLNMNYSDSNAATMAIKVNGERWLLSLFRIDDEFFIKHVNRTQ